SGQRLNICPHCAVLPAARAAADPVVSGRTVTVRTGEFPLRDEPSRQRPCRFRPADRPLPRPLGHPRLPRPADLRVPAPYRSPPALAPPVVSTAGTRIGPGRAGSPALTPLPGMPRPKRPALLGLGWPSAFHDPSGAPTCGHSPSWRMRRVSAPGFVTAAHG